MYTEAKEGRIGDALDHVEEKFNYQDEIRKLHTDLRNAQDELKVVVQEKQVTLALKAKAEQAMIDAKAELEVKKKLDASTSNMHKCLRVKAEKDREKLKDEKRKLEQMVAELLSQKEIARAKIRKIQDFCDEIYP
jgi:HJR/Mrr/RecB family endonuclease